MKNGLHFISGLPRSGSTLLSALLRQNPNLHANVSSGVSALVISALKDMSRANEASVWYDQARKDAVLRSLFEGYYHDLHPTKTIVDTNRMWCSKLPLLDRLFPDAKVICCVREPSWIYDSIESLIQRNPTELSRIFGFDAAGTVYDRFESLNRGNGLVGFAWNALRQAYFGQHAGKIMLLRYDTMMTSPALAMSEVYNFLGLPAFKHNFDKIEFDVNVDEFDTFLGTPGLHSVGGKISRRERPTVLPPDLFNRVKNDGYWNDPASNIKGVKIV